MKPVGKQSLDLRDRKGILVAVLGRPVGFSRLRLGKSCQCFLFDVSSDLRCWKKSSVDDPSRARKRRQAFGTLEPVGSLTLSPTRNWVDSSCYSPDNGIRLISPGRPLRESAVREYLASASRLLTVRPAKGRSFCPPHISNSLRLPVWMRSSQHQCWVVFFLGISDLF